MSSTKRWVKLYCKILDNTDLMRDDTAYIVFTKLMLMANSKGEVAETTRELSKQLNMPHSTLYKALGRLEIYQMVKRLSKQRYTLIYFCNWAKYQPETESGKHFGKQPGNSRETPNRGSKNRE